MMYETELWVTKGERLEGVQDQTVPMPFSFYLKDVKAFYETNDPVRPGVYVQMYEDSVQVWAIVDTYPQFKKVMVEFNNKLFKIVNQ